MSENELKAVEQKLNSLLLRLSDFDRRLKKIEQKVFPQAPASTPRQQHHASSSVSHSYLARAITTAKRNYEQKSG